ncbi:hypothetical protein RBI21_02445 [Klebsiella pneumoniae]|nr:hypothetical protein RBI21_02445 [Klebsiella pneumoniae]
MQQRSISRSELREGTVQRRIHHLHDRPFRQAVGDSRPGKQIEK